jgi:hypothetical protein
VASNTYNKTQVDELLGTWAFRLPSDALDISKVYDLQRQLNDINAIRAGMQASIGGTAAQLVYTQQDLTALTSVVATKQDKIDGFSNLDVSSISVRGALMAGPTQINSTTEDVSLYVGSNESYLRVKHGHHLDSYTREGEGRDLNLCNHTGSAVRCGSKLSIGQAPNNFQFSCNGAGSFTSFCDAFKFNTTSDQRIKSNITPASLAECSRLVQAVRPMTFTRNDRDGEAHIGYVAQHWGSELKDGFHNTIMGSSWDAEGPLLALDHTKICVILHGALLSALARIEALESRLQ